MSRPRICQLLHGMTVGGAEVLADRLARQFADRYEMSFVCLDQVGELGERLRRDGFTVDCVNRGAGIDTGCAWRLARQLKRQQADLVVAHQYTPFFYALAARCFGSRRPIAFVEHGRFLPDYPRRKRIVFNRFMIRKRDRLIAVGNDVRRALIENEGMPADRVEVIYNGVNLAPYQNIAATREATRRELGVAPNDFVIMQVARLDYLKDHVTAVGAMAELVKRSPQAVLFLIGAGPEQGTIEAEIARLGVANHIRLLGSRSDVPRLLGAADAMLLTSISEGIPLTLIEGMGAGLPIVSTDVGGVREVIIPEETALLAPAKDAIALAGHLAALAGNRERRTQLGEAGKERAVALFSEPVMHEQYGKMFAEMLSKSSRARPAVPQGAAT
jgi:glycosyltransferase involved in cell wall biosynthesis